MIPRRQAADRQRAPAETIAIAPPERGGRALLLKRAVQAAALLWVLPRLIAYRFATALYGRERAFLAASESLARIPGHRGIYCRQAFYRRTLRACGRDVYFGWMSTFSKPQTTVGERVYIGRRCGIGLADVRAGAQLADGVELLSGRHQHDVAAPSGRGASLTLSRIEIGNGSWLGTGAIVMANVGDGAIVGAGAVVVEPVPARTVAVGVPARVVEHIAPS